MAHAGPTPAVATDPPFDIGCRHRGLTDRMDGGDCHAMPAEVTARTAAAACAEPGVPFIGCEIAGEYAETANERVEEQER